LYPPSLRDVLLTLAALDAFDVRWSDEILGELQRNVLANHPDLDPERHFTVVLPDLSEITVARLGSCFDDPIANRS